MTFLIRVLSKAVRLSRPYFERMADHDGRKLCVCGDGAKLYLSSNILNARAKSSISIGPNTHVRGELQLFPNGKFISIGEFCYVGDSTRIWSMSSISIGNRVLISHGVNIHDNISHSLSAADRHEHFEHIFAKGHPSDPENVTSSQIVIEDDVWIGFNATVLKGVRVGRGAVVGACAVVTKDVSPYSIVVGNPARIIGYAKP